MNTVSAPLAQKAAAVVETVTAERCYAHSQTVMQLSAQLQPPQLKSPFRKKGEKRDMTGEHASQSWSWDFLPTGAVNLS